MTAISSMFDAIAARYDGMNRVLSAGRDEVWRRKAARLLPRLGDNGRVLDLCGGTGDLCRALRRQGVQACCVIGDFSWPMLALARPKRLQAHLAVMDALRLPLRDASFDAVICGFGMRNLESLEKGVGEIHRLLKPGGSFLTLDFFRPTTPFTRFFYRVFAPAFILLAGWLLGTRRDAYAYLTRSVLGFRSVEEYAALCLEGGFEKVAVAPCDFGIAHAVSAVKRSRA